MGSIFSFVIIIPASIIGAFFIQQLFQHISFFGLTQEEQFMKALKTAQKRKVIQNDSSDISTVTNSEIKD
jgi:hypothetical protein